MTSKGHHLKQSYERISDDKYNDGDKDDFFLETWRDEEQRYCGEMLRERDCVRTTDWDDSDSKQAIKVPVPLKKRKLLIPLKADGEQEGLHCNIELSLA